MINALFTLAIYALVLGIFVWLVHYLVDHLPVAEPFGKIAKIIAIVVAVLVILMLLLNVVNDGTFMPRLR